jgi:threonine aldolase
VVGDLANSNDQARIISDLKELGVLCVGFGEGRIRLVTHLDISSDDIDRCADIFKKILI